MAKNADHRRACRFILNRQLADALSELRDMAARTRRGYLNERIDNLAATYEQLLRHSFSGIQDPERDKVYRYLTRQLLELADELQEALLIQLPGRNIPALKARYEKESGHSHGEVDEIIGAITFDRELSDILDQAGLARQQHLPEREEVLGNLFHTIWLSDGISETENELLQSVCDSQRLPWHDKALIVSALTLSLLRYFSPLKWLILFRFVEKQEHHVWQRALVGLFLGALKYHERLYLYQSVMEKAALLARSPDISKHVEAIVIQFTKSKETSRLNKRWEEEILPAMLKMRPRIEDKLKLDSIFQDEFSEEKNPDWQTVFEDMPDLLDKLAEFTELQMEGMDVFMSAFSQLKQFPFFQKMANWFVPFYAEHPALSPISQAPAEGTDLRPLLQRLEETFYMCNSDKYSFCMNLNMIPEQQKVMMMNMLAAEMDNLREIAREEEMLGPLARSQRLYTQYFQDLYRFFKLHPWKQEFDDIFAMQARLEPDSFSGILLSDRKTVRNIAELYFDKKFYEEALRLFVLILGEDTSNIELFEKIAFCYEKTGDIRQAYIYYQRADLIESDRPWILRRLAFCSRMLNNWEEALGYYRQLEKQLPEDLGLQAHIGQCLIHLEQYQQALDYYFKLEVLAPENSAIRRPLAWCSFLVGKYETARDYLSRLLADEPGNKHDLMNMAHVLWCMGYPDKAFSTYQRSLAAWKEISAFEKALLDDRPHLIRAGIQEMELDLMHDYLKMKAF